MIAIIDYGMGNLRSVQKALERLGYEARVTDNVSEVLDASHVILPGVGAFGAAMTNLGNMKMLEPIRKIAASGRPFLGICLGMQLILSESEEQGTFTGLDIVPGRVIKFFQPKDQNESTAALKVPHMGWNSLQLRNPGPLLRDTPEGAMVYFVHSYYASPNEDVAAATTPYGLDFCSVIWKDNIMATQFHPEKSGSIGLAMLKNFAEME
jgi:imidazole glycerol-phosphate synthase subunit HisH